MLANGASVRQFMLVKAKPMASSTKQCGMVMEAKWYPIVM